MKRWANTLMMLTFPAMGSPPQNGQSWPRTQKEDTRT